MKRLCILAALWASAAQATVITGKIVDLTGQTQTSNRTVVFELQNCGNNLPRVVGASVIVPANKTVVPNAGGMLAGTIVGNDMIECGTTIGQTYYQVTIFAGTQNVYQKNYVIQGATWNIATALPVSNDPTAFLNYSGYLLGDLIYGAGTDILGLVRGNTTTKKKFLSQTGDGTHSGQPAWSDFDPRSVLGFVPLSSDNNLSELASPATARANLGLGTSSVLNVGMISGTVAPGDHIHTDYSQIGHTHVIADITDFSATLATKVSVTGSYSDPSWLTLSKSKVGLGNVENTALSSWAGTSSITAIGTLVSGTVPWARLGSVPANVANAIGDPGANGLVKRTSANTTAAAVAGTDYYGPGSTISAADLANSGVSANTYGSATNVPVFTLDTKGRVTAATTAALGAYQTVKANGTARTQRQVLNFGTDFSAADNGTLLSTDVTMASATDPAWLTITKAKVGLGSVENTALSTWTGATGIATVGVIGAGTWRGTAIADAYIASAAAWNAKQNAITGGTVSQYVRGDLSLASFPTGLSAFTNDANYLTTASSLAWAKLSGVPVSFNPSAHAASHAGTGTDPITGLGAVSYTGNLSFATDNTYDIGASAANRPRNVYVAGGLTVAGSITGSITGNAATVSNGIYSNQTYADPAWITSLAKSKVGLGSVENTALSAWTGTANLVTLGTVTTGVWHGTAITDTYIASAGAWNAKQTALTTGTTAQYFRGDLSLASFPTAVSAFTNDSGYLTSASSLTWSKLTGVPTFATTTHAATHAGAGTDPITSLGAVSYTGGISFATDNTYDIGASAANRPKNVYAAGAGTFGGVVTANQFAGSGAGLSSGTVPIAALVAGNYSSVVNIGTYSIGITGNAGTVTGGVYTTGSYSDPSWLTISKSKVGLSAVENTALSTWGGTSSITTVGTLSAGTVPWARLSGVPAYYYQSTKANSIAQTQRAALNFSSVFSLADDSVNNETDVSMASQTDPSWLTLTKAKVGLGSVENTALSTWIGSTSITTVGTLASLSVTATITGSVSGNAGTVTNGVYTNGSYSDPAWLTISKSKVGLSAVENTALSIWTGTANISTLGTIGAGTWHGTALTDTYIASAATWNAKQSAITTGTTAQYLRGDLSLAAFPASMAPTAHAATHAGAGSDPVTSLGAISHTGGITFGTDNTYDIGASGASRPRNVYIAGGLTVGGSITGSITGNAATVTSGVYTSGSYADPAWITSLAKSKVGLVNVENTALSTWAGTASVITLGTITTGVWHGTAIADAYIASAAAWNAKQSAITTGTTAQYLRGDLSLATFPTTLTPTAHAASHVSGAGDPLSGTLGVSITGNAATVTGGVYTTGSYTDPSWLTLTKTKVGLGSVENTALSTWAGTASITTIGTLAAGTVPWARLSGIPTYYYQSTKANAVAQTQRAALNFTSVFSLADDSVNNDTDVSMASQTDPAWLTLTKTKVGLSAVENTALSTWAGTANITTIGTLAAGTVPWARLGSIPSTFTPSTHAASHAGAGSDPITSLGAVSHTGNLTFGTDNTYDIGASAANRPRNVYAAGSLQTPSVASSTVGGLYLGGSLFVSNFQYGNNGVVTPAGHNTFVGQGAGNLTMGSTATASGQSSYNTAIGYNALLSNTTGYSNTANGANALYSNTTGYNNTANGVYALYLNTGYNNTANGGYALYLNTAGYNNTANGASALYSNTTGSYNAANGYTALVSNTTGYSNTANGANALHANTTGYNNAANGYAALYSNTTGSYNTANGHQAGYGSTVNNQSVTDTQMTFLGGNASRDDSVDSATTLTNGIALGYNAKVLASNQAVLGNDSITTTLLKGSVGIGTSPGYPLDVQYTNGAGGINETGVRIKNTSTANSAQINLVSSRSWSLLAVGAGGAPAGGFSITDNTAGTVPFSISTTGQVGIGTYSSYQLQLSTDSGAKPNGGSWTNPSDQRLKTNIRPFTDGLALVQQMQPKAWELNGLAGLPAGSTGIGFIAQDVKDLAPYLVGVYKAKLHSDDTDETELFNLNPSAMPFLLVNAINDLAKQTVQPVFAEDIEPACSEATRGQTRFVKDDLLGDIVRMCGRDGAGAYAWKTIVNF